jgi:predicted ArsR family transcriptional regulator
MSRPSFQASEEQRRMVKTMAALGTRHEDIAAIVDITPKTLRKHFRQELTRGAIEANAKVGQTLFAMATSGRNIAATIYWERTRGALRGRQSDTDRQPMSPPQIIVRTDHKPTESSPGEAPAGVAGEPPL